MSRLTLRRLRAIEEALIHRLAGEIDIEQADDDDGELPKWADYDSAQNWCADQIAKREKP